MFSSFSLAIKVGRILDADANKGTGDGISRKENRNETLISKI